MMQDTSVEIYLRKVYPDLGHPQAVVLHYLRNTGGTHTNAEIAAALNLRINEITPRTFELRKLGLVLEGGRRTCRITGNSVHQWKAKYPVLPPAFPEKPKVETNPARLL
jgi:hypothetical protein